MSVCRDDIRTEVRDYLAEAAESTAGIWTDAMLNRAIQTEIKTLPSKGIYLQVTDTTTVIVDTLSYDYPTGCLKMEKLERNYGTADKPVWQDVLGWKQYASKIWLPDRPMTAWTLQRSYRKKFTDLTTDAINCDVPEDKLDAVIIGASYRALKKLAAYLGNVANWDSISKPDGVSMSSVNVYLQTVKDDYKEVLKACRVSSPTRDIDLVS